MYYVYDKVIINIVLIFVYFSILYNNSICGYTVFNGNKYVNVFRIFDFFYFLIS